MASQDVSTARALLNGFLETAGTGSVRTRYFAESEEQDARLALCRLLRSKDPLDRQLRNHLANLFDPDPLEWEPRQIKLAFRRRGRHPDPARVTKSAMRVQEQVRNNIKVTDAIAVAAAEFSLDDEAVRKVWAASRVLLKQYRG